MKPLSRQDCSRPLCGVLAVAACLTATFACAQNRPVERAERQRAAVLNDERYRESEATVREDEEETGDETPLGVSIAAIRLISDQSKTTPSPAAGPEPVDIDPELPAPEGLRATLEPYVGEPVSMALLERLAKDIVSAWRESDHPLVDVYFPEQNITQGKIQVVVREAVLGEKRQEGAVRSRPEYLLDQLRTNPGDRINRRVVQSDLDWLNENPIRLVNVIYERGETDGTSDIVLEVKEEKSVTAYAGFANTGVNLTGENEVSFGFNVANPWRTEQSIGYQHTADVDWDSLSAHSVFYQAFLPWRHTLRLIGAHVSSNADDLGLLDIEGESTQVTAEYRVPLVRPAWNRRWRHAFTAAFDYKTTNTDLIFGGFSVFGTDIAIGQFRFEYDAEFPDELGYTRFTAGLAASPGDLYGNNDDASFMLARAGSEADYVYGFAEVERVIRLPRDWSLRFETEAQATGDRLASTEQLLAGGHATVRGYDESLVRVDSGLILNVELITPPFSVFPADRPGGDGVWNAYLFYDAAVLDISDALPGETSPSLQSVGLGLHCRLGELGFARASYGWAIESHGVSPLEAGDGKFHFGMTVTY
ncbi:MAG: ShlB/FhaC/HecB family hemolysin secretion/activation protein [Verrucomicrobiales bacterium]